MRRDEGKHRGHYDVSSCAEARAFVGQAGGRRRLVGWMAAVGEKLKMRRSTVHVAIAFLDRLFQRSVLVLLP
jgi:hypothetical protein